MSKNFAILILAAGPSSRLGRPKQLVEINGQPLLQKITETAIATGANPIVAVLGAFFKEIKPAISHLPIHILENNNWESGMGTTIACGMGFLKKKHPALDAVILLVGDQYRLSEKHISQLVSVFEKTNKEIVASAYGGTIGVPVLFSKNHFDELWQLKGQEGAKKIIQKHPASTATVAFPDGVFDLDTEDDLKKIT